MAGAWLSPHQPTEELAGPFDVGDSGRLCVALDPQGAAFGAWQAAEHLGAEIYNEPGALVW